MVADKDLKPFCRDLLIEMRKDRDLIRDTMGIINQQIGSIVTFLGIIYGCSLMRPSSTPG